MKAAAPIEQTSTKYLSRYPFCFSQPRWSHLCKLHNYDKQSFLKIKTESNRQENNKQNNSILIAIVNEVWHIHSVHKWYTLEITFELKN